MLGIDREYRFESKVIVTIRTVENILKHEGADL
jgi:hypothetical protein